MSELLLTTSLLQPSKLYPNKPALICGELGHRLLERPVSESRRLRHGDESLRMGEHRWRAIMLTCMKRLADCLPRGEVALYIPGKRLID